jgi:hypothetical protein
LPACTDKKNRIPEACCSHNANRRSSLSRGNKHSGQWTAQ